MKNSKPETTPNAANTSTLEKLLPRWIALGALVLAVGSMTGCVLVHDRGYRYGDRGGRDYDRGQVYGHDNGRGYDHDDGRGSGRGRGPVDRDRR